VAARYYDKVIRLAETVAEAGHLDAASGIEGAVRGGATGGEILTYLSIALRRLIEETPPAPQGLRIEAARLLEVADRALRRVGQVTPPPPKL
jgi:hypothetical protein